MSLVVIHSIAFPDRFLRMDGTGVTQFVGTGAGTRNNDGTVSFKSTAFPNVYLRIETTGVAQGVKLNAGGGVVNAQFGGFGGETFRIHKKETAPGKTMGVVGLEAALSPGRFLRLDGSTPAGVVNVQGVFGSYEEFEILVVG
ncbi:hypothetical protein BDN70DRAFT_818818 [Pholiota conissans]|uniref:Uncharacterized protein n=1 Tax=Pholiota conissans TaxID=109636 RepID=A0A9P5YPJ6_9AGAR|nr:hypothetical protein BDN70DRAFT_818818 [Pholiota conissans]